MPEAVTLVLGGGMTGLAAGIASGFSVIEATAGPPAWFPHPPAEPS